MACRLGCGGRLGGIVPGLVGPVGVVGGLEQDLKLPVVDGLVDLVQIPLLLRRGPLFVGDGHHAAGLGADGIVIPIGVSVKGVPAL